MTVIPGATIKIFLENLISLGFAILLSTFQVISIAITTVFPVPVANFRHSLAHALSDGTLRFICMATLLLQPSLPSLILLDEPELGLHPYAIQLLGSMLRLVSQSTQIIISTQSVSLANEFGADDVVVVEHHENRSTFKRLDAGALEAWLDDYRLGDLWEKNLLGGTPA